MKQEDFNFFKEFPNIQIRYEKRLHAKYYSNESSAIMTSMNLHSYSQDNNIETGVMTTASLLGNLANNLITNVTGEDSYDSQASRYFKRVIDQSVLLFHKVPQFDKGAFGTGLNKKYLSSNIEMDKLSDFFAEKPKHETTFRKDSNFESKKVEIIPQSNNQVQTGYCIRTGVQIPFNVNMPLCHDAFRTWSKFGDGDYPESFCHFSGEPSNGETCLNRPILRRNWKNAREIFNL